MSIGKYLSVLFIFDGNHDIMSASEPWGACASLANDESLLWLVLP